MKTKLLVNKKIVVFLFVFVIIGFSSVVKADEGMWLLPLIERLNYADMQKMGLKLTAEEIYSINNSSLKDAIVSLGGGRCSGSVISPDGLMLTNYHCAYSYVQEQSTVERDYLSEGFYAKNKKEELRNDGISVTFLVRMEDVTQKILSQIKADISEEERAVLIEEMSSRLETEAIVGTHYTAKISSFFDGNEFYLFVYETYKDVRLVFSPPESIGYFGKDTDNWMWPRHKGDFALFRIYMSPDGKPAPYNKKNIPYKSKHYLPISIKNIEKDDFAMVLGYPGQTTRFLTSYGVNLRKDIRNPAFVKIRTKKLELMKEDMDANGEIKIKYTAKYARSANYWKYFIGQEQMLEKLKVYDKKVDIETAFTKWVNEDTKRKQKYGNILNEISKAYDELKKYELSLTYFTEAIDRGPEIISYTHEFEELYKELKLEINEEEIYKLTQSLNYSAKRYFKSYNLETDKKIFIALLKMFYENVPKNQHPDIFITIEKKYKNSIELFAEDIYTKSMFTSKDKIFNFLVQPDIKKLNKDIAYITMNSFFSKYKEIKEITDSIKLAHEKSNRLFVAGVMEMQKDKKYYPNADQTLRLTYGKVTDYAPSKDVNNKYFTTLDELISREDPNNPDFIVPEKLKELYNNKDYGKYAKNGVMPVNFITNNDVIGGVSGAPVINGKGELIGVVFDINWEATSSPFAFDTELQRSINVDSRYMLFIIDKFAGATNIIDELKIVE